MLNSPASNFRAEKRSKTRNSIVPPPQPITQDKQEDRSLDSSPQDVDQQRLPLPPLPAHLDKLLDSAWNLESSRQIDQWLWYLSKEFEVAGGLV